MANLTTEFSATSNLPQVVEGDAKALTKRAEATKRSQEFIASIIARGDPLKALEVQRDREIRILEQRTRKEESLQASVEKAKAKIIADYAGRRQEILDREAAAARQATERAAAEQAAEAARTQARITSILERGEPLRALRRQTREELAVIRAAHREGVISQERFEAARAKLVTDYAKRRQGSAAAAAGSAVGVTTPGAGTNTADVYKQLTWVGERMEGVRSTMAALGAEANGAVSGLSMFSMQMVKGAGKATLLGFAIGAAAAGVAQLTQMMAEAERNAARIEFNRLDEAQIARLRDRFSELSKTSVVGLAEIGKQSGLTEEEIVRLGKTARHEAEMSGKSFDDSMTAAIERMGMTASQVRRDMDAFLASRFAAQAGDTAPFDDAAFNKQIQRQADAEADLLDIEKELLEIRSGRRGGPSMRLLNDERALMRQQAELRGIRDEAGRVADAMLKAKEETQGLLDTELADPKKAKAESFSGSAFGASIAEARAQAAADERLLEQAGQEAAESAARMARTAQERLADMTAEGDPLGALNLKLERELAGIAKQIQEAERLLADPASRASAQTAIAALQQQDEQARSNYLDQAAKVEVEHTRRYVKETNAALRTASKDAKIDDKATEQAAAAGLSAAGAFAGSFRSFLDSKDPMDLFGGLLSAASGILGMFSPVGGGIASLLGGFFEKGGAPFVHHMAQGRNGLAVLPRLNNDAKPAWLHEEEVVLPKPVVRDTFGGLPEALRVAGGGALPGGGGARIEVHNHIRAQDAIDAMAGFRRSMGQAIHLLSETRQSARAFDAMDRPAVRYA